MEARLRNVTGEVSQNVVSLVFDWFLPQSVAIPNHRYWEFVTMKFVSSGLAVAMLASTLVMSNGVVLPGTAEAASRGYCQDYAERKATKKTNKKVLRNTLIGAGAGAILGSILGGKRTTAFGAAGGAATGMAVGGSKWNQYYRDYYAFCRREL